MDDEIVTLEVFGEGRADVGRRSKTNPKSLLARICNVARNELSAKEKDSIAKSNSDL
jgi:hypothetical protein